MAPWLMPYAQACQRLAQQLSAGSGCVQALNNLDSPCPVRFVPQSVLPAGQAYEAFVYATGQVPTREGLHDLFNGLIWHHFPHSKAVLNRMHHSELAARGVQAVRGRLRDALTVFDENAALLQAPDALWAALCARDWMRLFITLRPLWQEARLVVFGHALLEKLARPRKAITAHVYRVQPAGLGLATWDACLAQDLSASSLAGKPFVPLPVLGVPGWWPANEQVGFYADAQVFRPARQHPNTATAAQGNTTQRP